ncbi:hypothetical protein GWO43_22480 [candidate division KSB1 bacterium]|nr:hypothetical protein [candidate division KSB1 bacterium]NIR72713.1 hypothetical protein [candidate division KSB1 bacterium]NIS26798.1 hypothetical protein [candidate division KSB1 bacterium]NIT73592.1 hypothetical protein [candidate division KSB1 bacterium]NIU27468.1 hypothetical protein [candidate division KSB1 bacterium]
MKLKYFSNGIILMFCFLLISSSSSNAQSGHLGVRGGYYTDAEEVFLGGEFLTQLAPRIYLNPNVEYIFVDNATFLTFNGDLHFDFPTAGRNYFWVGGGFALAFFDPEGNRDSETDAGLNLLFGAGFPTGSVIPYVQAKIILSESEDFVIGFGLRF